MTYVPSPELQKTLDRTKAQLMSREDSVFFTTVLFSLKLVWDTSIRTACTNGLEIRINPDFFLSLDPELRISLLIHESMHVALLHMERRQDREFWKWNMAGDHNINLQLKSRGFQIGKSWLADPQYQDMSTEEIYRLLPEESKPDDFELDITEPPMPMDELQKAVEEILIRAALQSEMAQEAPGCIPGDIQIFLNKLLHPKLPWQRILQKYIQNLCKSDYTWKRPNRRYFPNHYLPSLYSDKLIDIAIAVDASGSVTDDQFKVFVSETHGILRMMQPDKLTLIQFDTSIKAVNTIRSIRELANVKFHGRGGTRIEPVLEWANEHKPKVLLVFSDGCFRFYGLETQVNTVWLIHNHPKFTAPFGKVIHYEI